MKPLQGNRKFFIALAGLVCTTALSALVVINIPEQATALIAAVGGNVTAVLTPFMVSNYGENKVKAANGSDILRQAQDDIKGD